VTGSLTRGLFRPAGSREKQYKSTNKAIQGQVRPVRRNLEPWTCLLPMSTSSSTVSATVSATAEATTSAAAKLVTLPPQFKIVGVILAILSGFLIGMPFFKPLCVPQWLTLAICRSIIRVQEGTSYPLSIVSPPTLMTTSERPPRDSR